MPSDKDQSSSNPVVLILGMLAVSAAALFGIPRSGEKRPSLQLSSPGARPEADSSTSELEGSFEVKDVLMEYLRVKQKQSSQTSKASFRLSLQAPNSDVKWTIDGKQVTSVSENLADMLNCDPAKYEFLIATVPDPIESKFASEFDSVIDGIQRGFEAMGSLLRVSRLPWSHKKGKSAGMSDSAKPDRDHPGVLLFQKPRSENGEAQVITIVCLVGESPISGIHKSAMTNALKARECLIESIDKAHHAGDEKERQAAQIAIRWDKDASIKIIAPYFSGSQTSLIATLKSWKRDQEFPARLEIISGSATALRPVAFNEIPCFDDQKDLRATVIPNNLVDFALQSYLAGNRTQVLPSDASKNDQRIPHRVAILRETNTVFGEQRAGQDSSRSYWKEPPIDFPFPMSIHRLQSNADENAKNIVLLPQTGFTEPKLSNENRLDMIAPFDTESAASTAGVSLRTILDTINRASVRYVGIVATDPRDVIFLNRWVRKSCLDVRVFTTEPSVALLHPDEAYHLRGMLVGSTYPLNPVTQYWAHHPETPVQMIPFASQGSQGYFNAVLAQFEHTNLMLGYHSPLFPAERVFQPAHADKLLPAPPNVPPIWISVVGEGGRLVPVHCFTHYEVTDRDPRLVEATTLSMPARFDFPVAAIFAQIVAMILLGLVIWTIRSPERWEAWAGGLSETKATNRVNGWLYHHVWLCRGIMLAGILFIALPFSMPILELFHMWSGPNNDAEFQFDFGSRSSWIFLSAGVLAIEVLGVFLFLCLKIRNPHRGEGSTEFVLMALVSSVILLSFVSWALSIRSHERFFLYFRAIDTTTGLSPIVPISLIGATMFGIGVCWLQRACLQRDQRISNPYTKAWKGLLEADRELNCVLNCDPIAVWKIGSFTFSCLILLVPVLICGIRNVVLVPQLPSSEGVVWDFSMAVLFWITAFLVLLTLLQFLAAWRQLSQLLKEILRVPMVGAFEALPSKVTQPFRGYLFSQESIHSAHIAAAAWTLPFSERTAFFNSVNEAHLDQLSWTKNDGDQNKPTELDESDDASEAELKSLHTKAVDFLQELPLHLHSRSIEYALGSDPPKNPGSKTETDKADGKKTADSADADVADAAAASDAEYTKKERFIAAFVVVYLGIYFAQLRKLTYALVMATPLLLIAGASYPFQPDRPQLYSLVALLGAVAGSISYVFYKMNTNALISRIMRTPPDRFTPDMGFFSSIATYVLPLLTVIVLHLLGLIRFIVDPIISLLQ